MNYHMVILLLALGGCATLAETPKEVRIPVPIPCIRGDLPKTPAFLTDQQLTELGDYQFVIELWADRAQRQAYEDTLTSVLEACRSEAGTTNTEPGNTSR